ncbi:MAG: hypothetical protein CW346_18500 [Bacillaceae bacterium]|nr:hypothetical protein [Bacillaceae bacterium]
MASDLWFLLSDPYTWITLLDYTLGAIFILQFSTAAAVFLGANLVVYYYDLAYTQHPDVYCKIKIQSSARKTCRA